MFKLKGSEVDKEEGPVYKVSGLAQNQSSEKLMEHFIFALQIQFRGLLQMILVLGIGGSFPYGFHISVINYPSVVSSYLPENTK